MDPELTPMPQRLPKAWRRGNRARVNRATGYASLNRVDCLQGATGAVDSNRGRKG
jgi:hypothetical protein